MTGTRPVNYSIGWIVSVPILCLAWAVLFWAVFFAYLSWEILRIPMGLGGAVYPALFWPYVLVGALAWELSIGAFVRAKTTSLAKKLFVSLWLPFAIVSFLLIVFCPMDVQESYLSYVFSHRLP